MTDTALTSAPVAPRGARASGTAHGPMGWARSAQDWLDGHGRKAWIATMVAGFVLLWPVGLAVLFYMLATGRFARSGDRTTHQAMRMGPSTGNSAFDAYRADTIRRLEEERAEFEAFLGRLREAKDKAEFDQFMGERGKADAAE
ncbi:MAG: DUF2852 domain-containing protein [Paracoccaceae bacterium]